MKDTLAISFPGLEKQFVLEEKNFRGTMYAIAFDLDTQNLQTLYPNASWNNAYTEIRKALEEYGFSWQQGSVYFGDKTVNAVTCILAVQNLSRKFSWFAGSVNDIRMLRIEEMNDLMPAVV